MPGRRKPLVLLTGQGTSAEQVRRALVDRGLLVLETGDTGLEELVQDYGPGAILHHWAPEGEPPPEFVGPVPVLVWTDAEGATLPSRRVFRVPDEIQTLVQEVASVLGLTNREEGSEPPASSSVAPGTAGPDRRSEEDGRGSAPEPSSQAEVLPPPADLVPPPVDLASEMGDSILADLKDVLPNNRNLDLSPDIDLGALDSQTTLPGINVPELDIADSDLAGLDVSAVSDEGEEQWRNGEDSAEVILSESTEGTRDDRGPAGPRVRPSSEDMPALSEPIWMRGSDVSISPSRPSPMVTEVTGGSELGPTEDTVVGLKWKTQERRLEDPGSVSTPASGPDESGPPGHATERQRASGDTHSGPPTMPEAPPSGLSWCRLSMPRLPADLGQVLPLEVLLAAARSSKALALRFETQDKAVTLFVDRGRLLTAQCQGAVPSLLDWLERNYRLTHAQRETVERQAGSDPAVLRRVLTEQLALLRPPELDRDHVAYLASLVYELAGWRSGTVQSVEQSPPRAPFRPLEDWPKLVLEAVRRSYFEAEALGHATPSSHWTWADEQARAVALDPALVTETEREALRLLAGGESLGQAAKRTGLTLGNLAQIVHAFSLLGLVVPGPAQARLSQPEEGAPARFHEERILAKLEQVRDADYYTLLGVEPGASPSEVREAHARMKESFSEPVLPREVAQEFAEQLALIHRVLDEAEAVLTHPKYAKLYARAFRGRNR